jgi:hypothetical protein
MVLNIPGSAVTLRLYHTSGLVIALVKEGLKTTKPQAGKNVSSQLIWWPAYMATLVLARAGE